MNKQKGQMYNWITHTSTHLAGKCPHECEYCSIQDLQKRFPEQLPYSGELRLKEKEFLVKYGKGKTIFVENCNDLFASDVPTAWIERILEHCREWPENTYIFQTKACVQRVENLFYDDLFPPNFILGVTVETNRENNRGKAPSREDRLIDVGNIGFCKKFITIEPIMDFDLDEFAGLIISASPSFVNIGADSKGHGLPEPSIEKVMALIGLLTEAGIEIREKHNLDRLRT
jgi:hypothetical protein